MASPFVWGPCDVWLRFGGSPAIHLGMSEDGPDVSFRPNFSGVRVDSGGDVDFDASYQGTEARVALTLTRWNMAPYEAVHAAGNPLFGVSGTDNPGDIGALMVTESRAFELLLPARYSAKPVYLLGASGPQPLGVRFRAAFLVDDSWGRVGVKPRKLSLVFRCLRLFDPSFVSPQGYGYGQYVCWDYNVAAVGVPD